MSPMCGICSTRCCLAPITRSARSRPCPKATIGLNSRHFSCRRPLTPPNWTMSSRNWKHRRRCNQRHGASGRHRNGHFRADQCHCERSKAASVSEGGSPVSGEIALMSFARHRRASPPSNAMLFHCSPTSPGLSAPGGGEEIRSAAITPLSAPGGGEAGGGGGERRGNVYGAWYYCL